MAVTMKNAAFWNVTPCGFLRTDVSEEHIASIIRLIIISEKGATIAVASNGRSCEGIKLGLK
jgi:hypothetical protein